MTQLAIDRAGAALLIVDIQVKLAAAMPLQGLARMERNVVTLCELARRFRLPVVVSQQYPRGLGQTTPAIEQAVGALDPAQLVRFDKVEFSACAAPAWADARERVGRDQWIVTGMEAHVCVWQTVRQLCDAGASVHVPRDAVLSRHEDNWRVGLDLCARAGAVVTSTEVVVFDVLGVAGSDDFRAMSRLIR